MNKYLANLRTERANENTRNIDQYSTLDMVGLINEEDALVALAVGKERAAIAQGIDLIYQQLQKGGRLIYIGAGTSGRLGVLDASECPPTFGTPPEMVQGHIAGGDKALRIPVEGCEDNEAEGRKLIQDIRIGSRDVVVGITASGSASYVLAAMEEANLRGAVTIGLTTNQPTALEKITRLCIAPLVGEEVIAGSTRMKSGTAQKMVLNMLTTCVMIKMGKVYGNLMIDLNPSNKKLHQRALRLITTTTGIDEEGASHYLKESGNSVKLAILMIKRKLTAQEGAKLLEKCKGRLRQAIEQSD